MPEHEKAETPLQTAQRRVNEGRERITHLQQLLAELDREGYHKLARESADLLRMLKKTQIFAESDLARWQRAVEERPHSGWLAEALRAVKSVSR